MFFVCVQVVPRCPFNYSFWIMDSGASRHMTGDLSLLVAIEYMKGGYVAFAGDKGGFITAQGRLTNGHVSFDGVNYVEQIDHNLLSVSQISEKGYSTLFDSKGCYILKPGIKIPKEWVIMAAPRVGDLYVLDMNNASTTSEGLTCFVSKATEKETILWH